MCKLLLFLEVGDSDRKSKVIQVSKDYAMAMLLTSS